MELKSSWLTGWFFLFYGRPALLVQMKSWSYYDRVTSLGPLHLMWSLQSAWSGCETARCRLVVAYLLIWLLAFLIEINWSSGEVLSNSWFVGDLWTASNGRCPFISLWSWAICVIIASSPCLKGRSLIVLCCVYWYLTHPVLLYFQVG